jgi:hypothetical protein
MLGFTDETVEFHNDSDSLDKLRNNFDDVEWNKEILVRSKEWSFPLRCSVIFQQQRDFETITNWRMNTNLTTHNIQKTCENFIMIILEILSMNYNFYISCTSFEIYIPIKYSIGETSSLRLVKHVCVCIYIYIYLQTTVMHNTVYKSLDY